MASTMVRMRRLQKIEAALFMRAREIVQRHSQERQEATGQNGPQEQQSAEIAQMAAMPDMDRLATLQRYQTSLDRQLSKVIGEIRVLSSQAAINPSSAASGTPTHIDPLAYSVSTIDDEPR